MSLTTQNKKDTDKNTYLGNKGFTLVELIVVMLILTLMAAILVPSVLGWIDEARGKQYVLSARSLYMSAQAIESEKYAAWDGTTANANHTLSEADRERIARMADIEGAEIIDLIFESNTPGGSGASSNHGYFTIVGITVRFENVTVTLADGTWTVIQ